eukprot:g80523.t1
MSAPPPKKQKTSHVAGERRDRVDIVKVKADNQCLFHAIARICQGTDCDEETTAVELRQSIIQAVIENRTLGDVRLRDYLEGKKPELYAYEISQPGFWGGEQELNFFAWHYNVRLHELNVGGNDSMWQWQSYGPENGVKHGYLIYNGTHYDPVSIGGAFQLQDDEKEAKGEILRHYRVHQAEQRQLSNHRSSRRRTVVTLDNATPVSNEYVKTRQETFQKLLRTLTELGPLLKNDDHTQFYNTTIAETLRKAIEKELGEEKTYVVAFGGPPNAGKSSLINRLLGKEFGFLYQTDTLAGTSGTKFLTVVRNSQQQKEGFVKFIVLRFEEKEWKEIKARAALEEHSNLLEDVYGKDQEKIREDSNSESDDLRQLFADKHKHPEEIIEVELKDAKERYELLRRPASHHLIKKVTVEIHAPNLPWNLEWRDLRGWNEAGAVDTFGKDCEGVNLVVLCAKDRKDLQDQTMKKAMEDLRNIKKPYALLWTKSDGFASDCHDQEKAFDKSVLLSNLQNAQLKDYPASFHLVVYSELYELHSDRTKSSKKLERLKEIFPDEDATGIPELQRRLESACRQLGLAQLEEAKERCLEYLDGGLADYSQVTQSQMREKEDAFLELWESILSKMSKDLESAKKAGLAALDKSLAQAELKLKNRDQLSFQAVGARGQDIVHLAKWRTMDTILKCKGNFRLKGSKTKPQAEVKIPISLLLNEYKETSEIGTIWNDAHNDQQWGFENCGNLFEDLERVAKELQELASEPEQVKRQKILGDAELLEDLSKTIRNRTWRFRQTFMKELGILQKNLVTIVPTALHNFLEAHVFKPSLVSLDKGDGYEERLRQRFTDNLNRELRAMCIQMSTAFTRALSLNKNTLREKLEKFMVQLKNELGNRIRRNLEMQILQPAPASSSSSSSTFSSSQLSQSVSSPSSWDVLVLHLGADEVNQDCDKQSNCSQRTKDPELIVKLTDLRKQFEELKIVPTAASPPLKRERSNQQ